MENLEITREEAEAKYFELLEEAGLEHLRKSDPIQYSVGFNEFMMENYGEIL